MDPDTNSSSDVYLLVNLYPSSAPEDKRTAGGGTLQDTFESKINRSILSLMRQSFDARCQKLCGYNGDHANNNELVKARFDLQLSKSIF
jgi:hypothetical protein